MSSAKYNNVINYFGESGEAYATKNSVTYFAETIEAYFSGLYSSISYRNDFQPATKSGLRVI